jgi:hypothetical protein
MLTAITDWFVALQCAGVVTSQQICSILSACVESILQLSPDSWQIAMGLKFMRDILRTRM